MSTLTLAEVAEILRTAERVGADEDKPEGARKLWLSDTLATMMADSIERLLQVGHDGERGR